MLGDWAAVSPSHQGLVTLRPLLGIAFKVSSIVSFVVMMIFIKTLSPEVPIGQIIFFRALIGLAAIALVYALAGRLQGTFTLRSPRRHLAWSLTAGFSMSCWFVSITLIPLPEATAIGFVMPLITVALAWLMLGEQVRIFRWAAVLIGMIGVGIIIWPRLGGSGSSESSAALGAVLALLAASCWALAQIFMRRLTRTETSGSAVMSFSLVTMLLALLTLPLGWTTPSATQWALIAGCGLAGGFGQFCVAESLRHGEASTVAPFEYLTFPVASLAAAIIFSEYPDTNVWIGLPFVVAAGLFVIYREHQLAARAKAASSN
jgi:drug/metabolite transporter (DMT)-like permease